MTEIKTFLYNDKTERNFFLNKRKGEPRMEKKNKPVYVDVNEVCEDWGVCCSKGYAIIKELSDRMKKENPRVLVVSGKVNRIYYEEACMMR